MSLVPHAHEAVVCSCMSVDEEEIGDAIRAGARTIKEIGEACEAGTGCQTCHEALKTMLEDFTMRELRRSKSPGALHQLSLFGDGRPVALRGAARSPKKSPGKPS